MLATLVISGLLTAVPAAVVARPVARDPDPAIRLTLSRDGAYNPGDWARVHVRAARDGYLVVVQADPQGQVRVLFPVDPVDDHFIPGQREFEVRGRGDREAFQVGSDLGTGVVLAAWSPDPFRFDEFRRGERWDLRALEIPASELDLERGLTDLVTRMAPPGGFDYDVLRYIVEEQAYASGGYGYGSAATCFGCEPWGTSLHISIGSYWYDPWWYDPFYYRPWYVYYPRYYYPYRYHYYPIYYPVYYPYPRPYASYPYARNRYGWKWPGDAVATDRPDYRDRFASAFRDRTLGSPDATPDVRRRLPSLGERQREQETGVGARRRVTTGAVAPTTPDRTPDTRRRTGADPGTQPAARPARPETTRGVETPRRRTTTQPEARPSSPTRPEARPSAPRRDETRDRSGSGEERGATPAPSSRDRSSGATRRRSESAATPARASGRPVDARRQEGLPAEARAVASTRRQVERPELRPASARRVEPSGQVRGAATRARAPESRAVERRVESRPARAESRPARVESRPARAESRPARVESRPARAESRPSGSSGGASRGGSPGGGRQASPGRSGGGGGRRG